MADLENTPRPGDTAALLTRRLIGRLGELLVSQDDVAGAVQQVVTVTAVSQAANLAIFNAVLAAVSQNAGKTINRFVLDGASDTTEIAAASPGNKHKIIGLTFTLSDAGTVQFASDSTVLTGPMNLPAATFFILPPNPSAIFVETAAGEALNIVQTSSKSFGIVLFLTEP